MVTIKKNEQGHEGGHKHMIKQPESAGDVLFVLEV